MTSSCSGTGLARTTLTRYGISVLCLGPLSNAYGATMRQSKQCSNPSCRNKFTPMSNRQAYCTPQCNSYLAQRKVDDQADHKSLNSLPRNAVRPRRECLKCNKMFLSAGSFNRICLKCKGMDYYESRYEAYSFSGNGRPGR